MLHHDKRHDEEEHVEGDRDHAQRIAGLDDLVGIPTRAGDAGVETQPREGDGRALKHREHADDAADGEVRQDGATQHPFLRARRRPLQERDGDAGLHDRREEEVEELEEEDPLQAVREVLYAGCEHRGSVLAQSGLRTQHEEGDESAKGQQHKDHADVVEVEALGEDLRVRARADGEGVDDSKGDSSDNDQEHLV